MLDFGNDTVPASLRFDAIHLNTAGYGIVAQTVYTAYSSAIPEPSIYGSLLDYSFSPLLWYQGGQKTITAAKFAHQISTRLQNKLTRRNYNQAKHQKYPSRRIFYV